MGGLLRDIGVPDAKVAAELAAMEHVAIGATASRAVLGCMNDAVYQLGAYPRGRRVSCRCGIAALHLADNIYSLTNYQTPWLRTLELFGVQGTVRVARVPRELLH